MNNLEKLLQDVVVGRLYLKHAELVKYDGSKIPIDECTITNIESLEDSISQEKVKSGKIDPKKLQKQIKLTAITPDGETIELDTELTNSDVILEMERITTLDEESRYEFLLREEMDRMVPNNVENILGVSAENAIPSPKDFDELAEQLTRREDLVPKDLEDAFKVIQEEKDRVIRGDNRDDRDDKEKSDEDEEKEADEELKEIPKIPDEVKDEIKKLCQEHNLRISQLKQVLVTSGSSVVENGDNTGIRDTNEKVTMLRFRDATMVDKVVIIQDGNAFTNSGNDRRYSELMDRKITPEARELSSKESKVIYTDENGNTFVDNIVRTPNDLTISEKEEFQQQWNSLEESMREISNSDLSEEEKVEAKLEINDKKLALMEEYGVNMPIIEERTIEDKGNEEQDKADLEENKTTGRSFDHEPDIPQYGKNNHFN